MSQQTLKDLLKPPFEWKLGLVDLVCGNSNGSLLTIGSNSSVNSPWLNEDDIYKEFKDFVEKALNEKWERDFGERSEKII
jgi:hypothetical protein